MAEDIVRVLRVIEYVGPRSVVENAIKRSLHGFNSFGDLEVRAATLGLVPDILEMGRVEAMLPTI